MTAPARLGAVAAVVKKDKGKQSEGVKRERGRAMGGWDAKGERVCTAMSSLSFTIIDAVITFVITFVIPSLSLSLVLRRGEMKLEEREDIAGLPAEQGQSHYHPPLTSSFRGGCWGSPSPKNTAKQREERDALATAALFWLPGNGAVIAIVVVVVVVR
ncbi:hypothetical protein PIB30_074228 [Stylosanthes scabra]|uniref:Uncharacterized protein n=1 Tax=Stylosanthes scabra TaxID=79078 RepID=A0ABU6RPG7_9FABA|nr:hypothetical protein [Stylosanthes scabra]